MPALKYKDTDGTWKLVPVGGSASSLPTAGAGLTGGTSSYDVGAGTGIIVSADQVAVDKAYTDTLYSTLTHVHAVNDLTDADTVSVAPVVGDALTWDGTNWVPKNPNARWSARTERAVTASAALGIAIPHADPVVLSGAPAGTYHISSVAQARQDAPAQGVYGILNTEVYVNTVWLTTIVTQVDNTIMKLMNISCLYHHTGGNLRVDVSAMATANGLGTGCTVWAQSSINVARISD